MNVYAVNNDAIFLKIGYIQMTSIKWEMERIYSRNSQIYFFC